MLERATGMDEDELFGVFDAKPARASTGAAPPPDASSSGASKAGGGGGGGGDGGGEQKKRRKEDEGEDEEDGDDDDAEKPAAKRRETEGGGWGEGEELCPAVGAGSVVIHDITLFNPELGRKAHRHQVRTAPSFTGQCKVTGGTLEHTSVLFRKPVVFLDGSPNPDPGRPYALGRRASQHDIRGGQEGPSPLDACQAVRVSARPLPEGICSGFALAPCLLTSQPFLSSTFSSSSFAAAASTATPPPALVGSLEGAAAPHTCCPSTALISPSHSSLHPSIPQCLEKGQSVLVSAHTSAGKTAIAEYAIAMAMRDKQR